MPATLIRFDEISTYGNGLMDKLVKVAVFQCQNGHIETLSMSSIKFDAKIGDVARLTYVGYGFVAHKENCNV